MPQEVSALPREDPRRRANSSKGQLISQRGSGCLFDPRNYRAWSRGKRKGAKFVHRTEDWSIGSCSRRDTCSSHTHAQHGRPWDNAEKWETQEDLAWSKHPLQYRKWWNSPTWNSQTVQRPVLRQELKIPCLWKARCKRSSWNYRHHPVCRGYKSGNRCIYGHRCIFRHADGEKKPSTRSRKEGTQGAVAILREKRSKVVYLKTQIQWILFHGKLEKWDLNASAGHTMKFSGCTWYETKIPKRWTSWAKSFRVWFWGTNTWGNLTTSRLWQQRSVEFGEKKCTRWAWEIWAQIKWVLCGEGPETPMTVSTGTSKVQINEDAQVFAHDLDLFVTVRLLDETPAVLSLRMLCSKHGNSFEWKNGETPRLANNGKTTTWKMDNFVFLVVPGLSSHSSSQVRLQHRD